MTSAESTGNKISLNLSRAEALVLFEWLSRNWEKTHWDDSRLFVDPAERQVLIWLEADLAKLISETFNNEYAVLIQKSYREVLPDPESL